MSGIHELIDSEVKCNNVVLFMKGTPQFPQCGFRVRSSRSWTILAWI